MRVLLLNSERGWRGGEHQTLLLSRGLAGEGIAVSIAAPGGSPLATRGTSEGFPVIELSFESPPMLTPLRIARDCRRKQFDILHAQTSRAHTHCRLARAIFGAGARLIVSRRTAFPVSRGPSRVFKYGRGVDRFLPISEAAARRLREAGVDESRMTLVPSGIETARFRSVSRDDVARRDRGLAGRIVAGTVAAPTPEKGLDVLSQAGRMLAGGDEGESGPRIVFLARTAGGRDLPHIRRVDPAETTMEAFFSLLDLYVVPSREEGLSTALMAAVAAGLPVAGSSAGGIPEIAREDHSILVEPGNAAALAGAVHTLAVDEALRKRFSRRARERGDAFDIAETVAQTIAVYREILGPAAR